MIEIKLNKLLIGRFIFFRTFKLFHKHFDFKSRNFLLLFDYIYINMILLTVV